MSETTLLIDSSNAWYRAWMATHLDKPGGPVMIMTYMLRRVCDRFGKQNVVICLDKGSGGRKEIDPDYKSQRTSTPGVWEDFPFMLRMIRCLGIQIAEKDGYEADDVIGSLAKVSKQPVYIQSYDKDFYQLVDDKIRVLRPEQTVKEKKIPEKIVDRDLVMEEFGCSPEKVILCKSFLGDHSDNIPKLPIRFVKNFKEDFYKLLLKSKDVNDFYTNINLFDDKYKEDLLAFKDRALLNERLVTIQTNLDIKIKDTKLDADEFEKLCRELKITRLRVADWEAMPAEAPPPEPVQGSLF